MIVGIIARIFATLKITWCTIAMIIRLGNVWFTRSTSKVRKVTFLPPWNELVVRSKSTWLSSRNEKRTRKSRIRRGPACKTAPQYSPARYYREERVFPSENPRNGEDLSNHNTLTLGTRVLSKVQCSMTKKSTKINFSLEKSRKSPIYDSVYIYHMYAHSFEVLFSKNHIKFTR